MLPSAESLLGKVIGGYRLERIIGTGGTGAVFVGNREVSPGDTAAIKVLLPPTMDAGQLAEFHARFSREAHILSEQLRHPHILPVLAFGEDEASGLSYMVMPYIASGTLAARLAQGPLPLATVTNYVSQLAEALDSAHAQQIVHRDLKPANVLVDENGQIYLADFGIVKLFETAATTLTDLGRAIGTPEYMAPEQAQGQLVSAGTDIYGLGMLAYQLVTGQLPFPAANVGAMLVQVLTMQPPSPQRARPDLPAPAAAAILCALAKTPAERFASAGAFAQAFARGVQGLWSPELAPQPTVPFITPSTVTAAAPFRSPFGTGGPPPVPVTQAYPLGVARSPYAPMTPLAPSAPKRGRGAVLGTLLGAGAALVVLVLFATIALASGIVGPGNGNGNGPGGGGAFDHARPHRHVVSDALDEYTHTVSYPNAHTYTDPHTDPHTQTATHQRSALLNHDPRPRMRYQRGDVVRTDAGGGQPLLWM